MMAAERLSFTLPPAPDEARQARIAEEEAKAARRAVREPAGKAWACVPATHDAPAPELLGRCAAPLRKALAALETTTLSALLMGPSGSGKSTAAALLVRRAISGYVHTSGQQWREIADLAWFTATDLAMADKRHPLGEGLPPTVARAMSASALVLDDVGLEPPGSTAIFGVLSARYDQCRPTIVTTGLGKAELTAHLSAAGVRRIVDQHAAGYKPLVVDLFQRSRN